MNLQKNKKKTRVRKANTAKNTDKNSAVVFST